MKNLETLALLTVLFASAAGLIGLALAPQPAEIMLTLAITFGSLFCLSAKMLITFGK